MAGLPGASYVVRRSVYDIRTIKDAKKAIRTAFRVQMACAGFSMVEFLSSCPTNWGLSPLEALSFVEEHMIPAFPLGDYKVAPAVAELKV